MSVSDAQRLRQLEAENSKQKTRSRKREAENAKLRRVVADLTLDNVALKDVFSKNGETRD